MVLAGNACVYIYEHHWWGRFLIFSNSFYSIISVGKYSFFLFNCFGELARTCHVYIYFNSVIVLFIMTYDRVMLKISMSCN